MTKASTKPAKTPKPRPSPKAKPDPNDKAAAKLYGASGVNAGNALINKFLPEGALGRVSTNLAGSTEQLQRQQALMGKAGNSAGELEAQQRMQAGLGGYTSGEYQASREQMMRGVQSNFQTGQAQLAKAQARGKVYGAAGAAQQANLITSSNQSKDQLEQDLMVKNIDEQQRRLQDYGKYSTQLQGEQFDQNAIATKSYGDSEAAMRDEQLGREKVNLGQANAETAGQIGLFTGAGSTALAKAQAKEATKTQRQGIAAINGGGRRTTTRK